MSGSVLPWISLLYSWHIYYIFPQILHVFLINLGSCRCEGGPFNLSHFSLLSFPTRDSEYFCSISESQRFAGNKGYIFYWDEIQIKRLKEKVSLMLITMLFNPLLYPYNSADLPNRWACDRKEVIVLSPPYVYPFQNASIQFPKSLREYITFPLGENDAAATPLTAPTSHGHRFGGSSFIVQSLQPFIFASSRTQNIFIQSVPLRMGVGRLLISFLF